jgi:RNA polymerase sigma factor (sigma-70 family)
LGRRFSSECALQAWKFQIPDDPKAWLTKVARNRALDVIRHGAIERRFADDYRAQLASEWSLAITVEESLAETSTAENQLRMMFTLCHPPLSEETQVTLILEFLCGFASSEIAAAFLCAEETIDKRLQRGRTALRQLGSLTPVTSMTRRIRAWARCCALCTCCSMRATTAVTRRCRHAWYCARRLCGYAR